LIAIDVDGTLLNSQHGLSTRNEQALRAASEQGVHIVFATGKTFHSTVEIVKKLNLNAPGIYMQGTATYNHDGAIRRQFTLKPAVLRQAITFAEDRGFDVALYSGNRILARSVNNRLRELTTYYHEPLPEPVGPLQNILDTTPFNKMIFVKAGETRQITALRWQLSMQINGSARVVQAGVPDHMEMLPTGASKGAALKMLLKDLGIPTEQAMAIGDAENDIEMIEVAGMGVAVNNAAQAVKDVAQHVVASNDDDGVAEAIERFVLKSNQPAVPAEA
jgi:Cof subfamily protein (haloacid dehalogenase superfamily)